MMNDFPVTTLLFHCSLRMQVICQGNRDVAFNESAFLEWFVAARVVNCYEKTISVVVLVL